MYPKILYHTHQHIECVLATCTQSDIHIGRIPQCWYMSENSHDYLQCIH